MLSFDSEEGGLKMINIENQQKMFLTKWSAKLIQEKDTFWAQIVKQLFKPLVDIHSTLNATVPPNYNQSRLPFLAGSHKSNDNNEQNSQSREHQDRTNLE